MASRQCSKCAQDIERDAKYCRHCGAEQVPKEKSPFPIGTLLVVAITIAALLAFSSLRDTPEPAVPEQFVTVGEAIADINAAAAEGLAAADAALAAQVSHASGYWTYTNKVDDIRGGSIIKAENISTNTVDFSAPYDGGSSLKLAVRKHPEWGTDVWFRISDGQMLCAYDGCYATVRFDNDPSQRFYLSEPADHSTESIFITDVGTEEFIERLKKADRLIVELEFYRSGRPQFTFDVSDLHWPPEANDY
jgi:hypothetical protein